MKYTVIWLTAAEDELTRIWLAAVNRRSVADAAARIEAELLNDPENAGESRAHGRRILIAAPLAVIFRVFPDERIVFVTNVREFGSRAK